MGDFVNTKKLTPKEFFKVLLYAIIGAVGFVAFLYIIGMAEEWAEGFGFFLLATCLIGIVVYMVLDNWGQIKIQGKSFLEGIKEMFEGLLALLKALFYLAFYILVVIGILFALRAFVHFLIY